MADRQQSGEASSNNGQDAGDNWISVKTNYDGSIKPRIIFIKPSDISKFFSKSLDTPYLDAVARGDMATAERMVREAAGKEVSITCRGLQAIFSRLRLAASQQSIYEYI